MTALTSFDSLVKEFDKQGANAEYALYVNRTQDLAIDDLLAKGNASSLTSGIATQYGAFNNDKDMADS